MKGTAGCENRNTGFIDQGSRFVGGFGEGASGSGPHLLGGDLHELDRAVEVPGDQAEVLVGELLEVLPARFQHGYKRMANLLGATGIEVNHDTASILYITLAADEVQPFEPVDEPCYRAC